MIFIGNSNYIPDMDIMNSVDGEELLDILSKCRLFIYDNNSVITRNIDNEDIAKDCRDLIEKTFYNEKSFRVYIYALISNYIIDCKDVYVSYPTKNTRGGIFLYELLGFLTDRYNTNYTEINCIEDFDDVTRLEIAAPYLTLIDNDKKEFLQETIDTLKLGMFV